MPAPTYDVAYHVHLPCSPDTGTFRFGKPEGYAFRAGQYFSLTLTTREGEQTKPFSHDDAPGDRYIELTTRLTGSPFKEALLALRPHQVVRIAGPHGHLTVPPGVDRVGFMVGGVGVAPAHSIIRDSVKRGTGLDVLAFFGNPDQSCIPFKAEFDSYEASDAPISFVHVLQRPLSGWTGETGLITADLIRRHCDPLDGRYWISAGPPAMSEAMRRVATQLRIPADRFALELFTGYA